MCKKKKNVLKYNKLWIKGGFDPMFNKLYDNCFKTELQTEVIKVKEDKGMYWHAFKDTIFYVEGGGMESDIGMIDRHMVHG